jgi:hypothetical protein
LWYLQSAKPVAAKLYAGATNASYQANATRDAAQQTLKAAQAKLSELQLALRTAQGKKQAVLGVMATVPGQLGAGQFKVGADVLGNCLGSGVGSIPRQHVPCSARMTCDGHNACKW